MAVSKLFTIERSAPRGLLAWEWVIVAYAALTTLMVLFCATSYADPAAMLWTRGRLVAATVALWGLYRLAPCRALMLVRVTVQVLLLGEWYPDTYSLNCILPNLDHIVAAWDQALFSCQPALLFHTEAPWLWFSELMYLGYGSYYWLLVGVPLLFFIRRYEEFGRAAYIIITSFFLFYLAFDIFPVVGPQYYFAAIGTDTAASGVFPDVGRYFATHSAGLPLPGPDGPCRAFVMAMHSAGERPTAAFPSSHVGVATVILFLAVRLCRQTRRWGTLLWYVPLYLLLCLSTVYIQAHYAIDALAGLVSGTALYFALAALAPRGR